MGGVPGATRDLFRRGSVYTLATASQLAVGAVLIPVLTRVLPSEEYGVLATLLVVVQLISNSAGLGLQASITREYFDHQGSSRARALLLAPVGAAVLIVLLLDLTSGGWCGIFAELRCGFDMRLALWSAVPLSATTAALALLRAENRAGAFAFVAVVGSVGAQSLGLGVVLGVERSATEFFLGLLGGYAAAALLGFLLTLVGTRLREALPSLSLLRKGLGFGLPTVPHALALFVMSAGDRVIVERLLGLEAVARYQPAYVVGALGMMGLAALNNAWAPLILGTSHETRWSVLAGTAAWVDRLVWKVTAGLMLGAPLLLRVAVPGSYDPDALAPVTTIIALSVMAYAFYLANMHILSVLRKVAVLTWAAPVSALVNVGLNLLLVPQWGLEGAAVATVLSYALLAGIVRSVARRHAKVAWRWSDRGRAWIAASATLIVGMLFPHDVLGLILRGVAAGGLAIWALVEASGWRASPVVGADGGT